MVCWPSPAPQGARERPAVFEIERRFRTGESRGSPCLASAADEPREEPDRRTDDRHGVTERDCRCREELGGHGIPRPQNDNRCCDDAGYGGGGGSAVTASRALINFTHCLLHPGWIVQSPSSQADAAWW